MPKTKLEAPNIDLRCILCPKTPRFSDISHLLTHIASKSHLSHKFRLGVESRHQPAAREKLEDFEFWYNHNNLDEMLVDRLAAKEDKKTKKTRAALKREYKAPEDDYDTSSFRAPNAKMLPFPTRTRASSSAATSQWNESIYSTPTARSKVPNFAHQNILDENHLDPMLVTPWKPNPDDGDDDKLLGERSADSAKLKGIQWPGMRVFDSATPEGKRMRNQRKDGRVLRDMIATSKGVEPAEISYHPNGDFRASRDIFGPLSTENSPVQIKRPSPKKRRARGPSRKPTFESLSTNRPRGRVTRGRKTSDGIELYNNIASSSSIRPSVYRRPPPVLNPLAAGFSTSYDNHRYMSALDEEEEFKLTLGDIEKKRGFTIFEDELSPARTESPLEETRFEFPNRGTPSYPTNSMTSAHMPTSPTPMAKHTHRNNSASGPSGSRVSGVHALTGVSNQHHTRRTMSDSQAFAPQAFLHDSNPLFNHGYAYNRTFQYGPQYMFSGNHATSYMENTMDRSPLEYSSTFMDDFQQHTSIENASTSDASQQHDVA